MDDNKAASSANKLALITEQRSALEKVVKISLAITRLQSGLESMLILGQETSQLSQGHIKTFEIISKSIKHLPTDKLKSALTHLDSYINTALHSVMDLVAQGETLLIEDDVDAGKLGNIHKDIHSRLNTFRRKSQTAVVVRLLLRKRGINTAPFSLPIPESSITDKITELEGKEKHCRQRIKNEIDIMETYVDSLLKTEGLPASTCEEMREVKASLQKNRQHLLAGRPIEEMPIVFEIIEMGDESKIYDLGSDALNEEQVIPDETQAETEQNRMHRGFYSRLKDWLASPVNVRWKDIDKYK
ncbi:hypothetical protein [Sulfuriflexus mobilis]|uniref:hypothetical protein n=1 Tax=Sulfuriflexus mobilis TaxID=1811807 RepID=UPI000F84DE6A|nr:hypothetical protein [Sulfuriflexus mobilis]